MTIQDPIDPADWVTLWQSELAALAVDRECHETLAGMAHLWFTAGDAAAGRPGADAAAGAPATGTASGARGEFASTVECELADLRRRVAELERAPPG